MNYDIKEIVKNKNPCTFQNFRKGHLWYKTDCGFEFPVPVDHEEIGMRFLMLKKSQCL